MAGPTQIPDAAFKLYEDGKHRRYTLLFAVNGGGFAIAKLLLEPTRDFGQLTRTKLALGMILFTLVMSADIFMFGEKMRTSYLPDAFGLPGKTVLLLLAALLCAGWALAA